MKYKLLMEGLDCAHCASKVEQAVAKTDGFENVSLVFAKKTLYFEHSKDKNIVKMHLSNKELVINSYASEIGKVEERVKVDCNVDTNLDISFSSKYMLEALRTFKDEQILILLNGEVKPIVIKSTEDESLIQLILPLKTY